MRAPPGSQWSLPSDKVRETGNSHGSASWRVVFALTMPRLKMLIGQSAGNFAGLERRFLNELEEPPERNLARWPCVTFWSDEFV
jgi:hypothetical protein